MKNHSAEAFDPKDFGFEMYVPNRAGCRVSKEGDYMIYTPKSDKTGRQLVLSLCSETHDFVKRTVGCDLTVYVNDAGNLLLTASAGGNGCKMYRRNQSSNRATIAISGLIDKMFDRHGAFKRLYVKASPFGNDNAVLLKPTGERDGLDVL